MLFPLRQTSLYPHFHEIIPNLFIGNYRSPEYSTQFDLIVNCTKHLPITFLNTIRISVDDHPSETRSLIKHVRESNVLEKIHQSLFDNKKVLVHCHAGMQRSCAVVAFYLLKYYNTTPEEVIRYIREKRSIAFQPEPTFREAIYDDLVNKNK